MIHEPIRYVKKPLVVHAMRLTQASASTIAFWCNGTIRVGRSGACQGIEISTLEGVMVARPGDYVIQGIKGEFYPCKRDIFEATYEPVPSTVREGR